MVQSSVWGLEFTLFSPIHHPNSSDLASKMSFQKKKTLFGCFGPFFSWTKLQKFTLTSYTLLLRSVLYSSAPHCASFLPWSCTQSWISSSHWALLPVQVFKVHNLQRQAQIYVSQIGPSSGSEGRLCLSEDAHRHTHGAEISIHTDTERIGTQTQREVVRRWKLEVKWQLYWSLMITV